MAVRPIDGNLLAKPNKPMLERVDQADSGCDRCSGPEDTALDAGGAHDFRVVGDAIYYCDSDYGWEGTKIKFCPWCGRSLASNTQVDILTRENTRNDEQYEDNGGS